jgi:hypothetical protein
MLWEILTVIYPFTLDLGRFKSLHHYQGDENEWGALMSSFSVWTDLPLLYLAIASIEATLVDRRLMKPILNRLGLALTIELVIATGWTCRCNLDL